MPVNRKALDETVTRTGGRSTRSSRTAVDQLHARQPSVASSGCLLGVMPQARKATEDGLEQAIIGSKPAEQAMKDAAASVKKDIDNYNAAVR